MGSPAEFFRPAPLALERRGLPIVEGRALRKNDHAFEYGKSQYAEQHDRDQSLDQRFTPIVSGGERELGHQMFADRKMPYIAEIRATDTNPTMPPMNRMTAGSMRVVTFLSL